MFEATPTKILANAVHTYANYDILAENGPFMKEDKDHYAFIILSYLENKFKGMNKEDVELFLHLCSQLDT